MEPVYLKDFTYALPDERIALYPLQQRDQSKLLFYNKGTISHKAFTDLPALLPANTTLFFNNTKVIPARLLFTKDTGAAIEVFLLNPVAPSSLLSEAMKAMDTSTWHCIIGNLKRWTAGLVLSKDIKGTALKATLTDREKCLVTFTWDSSQSFAELIVQAGTIPLPPYIHRAAEATDTERYQTVYSHYEGAVAAPTAGLHFTEAVLQKLKARAIETDFLTLHVSAGTFQPVKAEDALEHTMHNEQVVITRGNLQTLLAKDRFVVAVGTTSMRTLESLYWYGVKLLKDQEAEFSIAQNDPYENNGTLPSTEESLQAIVALMNRKGVDAITGSTSIFILPGYQFRVCRGLVTNFHQPGSTLILLVAAFTGPAWKTIYQQALEHDYRFLSYGDSSLLIP